MAKTEFTAKNLLEQGIKPKTPADEIRDEITDRLAAGEESGLARDENLQRLYPNTILDTDMLETVTTALLSGSNVLLYGPSGSGKTTLAKDIWNLYPKKKFVVDGCPVHDDPFSIFDADFCNSQPPCPFCRMRFSGLAGDELGDYTPSNIPPENVPIRTVTLREGAGFSRVQGSAEIFPDNLTGTLNLRKLSEIGDPMSPLVFEPGKLIQAHRGVFICDEIGKLPIGTQNVLLQALQENEVSPAKSRETFPASFISVCTSNLEDIDNITRPLSARLVSIHIGYNREHRNNRKIVDTALSRRKTNVFMPSFLIETDVNLIEEWRNVFGENDGTDVGSNRTMIDVALRGESRALLNGARTVGLSDFRAGTVEALAGRMWFSSQNPQAKEKLDRFVGKYLDTMIVKSATIFWCKFFNEVLGGDKAEAKRICEELGAVIKDNRKISDYLSGNVEYRKADKWSEFVAKNEMFHDSMSERELGINVFAILNAAGIFDSEVNCK